MAVADDILRGTRKEGGWLQSICFLGLARLGLADRAEAEGRKADTDRLLDQAVEALGESVRLKSDNAPAYLFRGQGIAPARPAAGKPRRSARGRDPPAGQRRWEAYLALSDVLAASGRKADAVKPRPSRPVNLAHPNEPRSRNRHWRRLTSDKGTEPVASSP